MFAVEDIFVKQAIFAFMIIFLLYPPGTSRADDGDSQAINWALQNSLGAGVYIGDKENAKIYKLPLSYTFRDINEAGWALKFTLPVTIGIYDIKTTGGDIDLDVTSVVPGIELQIPLQDDWLFIPFAGFGAGKDISGGEERYLYSLGIKHYVFSRWKSLDFTMGNTLRVDGFSAKGGGRDGSITSLDAGLDTRLPIGFKFSRNPGYLSFYGVIRHYFNGTVSLYTEEKKFGTRDQVEFGITLSTIPSWKIWGLSIDRLGIGYRSGDRISTVRLVFGMPF